MLILKATYYTTLAVFLLYLFIVFLKRRLLVTNSFLKLITAFMILNVISYIAIAVIDKINIIQTINRAADRYCLAATISSLILAIKNLKVIMRPQDK